MRKLLYIPLTLAMSILSVTPIVSAETTSSTIRPFADEITDEFADLMLDNAAYIGYYALSEERNGTWPLYTGTEFASKVRSRGAWDYKRVYGARTSYYFDGLRLKGEDLGNMHYGFVGRSAGFPKSWLRSAAGAYQIYSGTSYIGWYNSYFDDPNDQKWINDGMNRYDNGSVISGYTISAEDKAFIQKLVDERLTEEDKKEIEKKLLSDIEKNTKNYNK